MHPSVTPREGEEDGSAGGLRGARAPVLPGPRRIVQELRPEDRDKVHDVSIGKNIKVVRGRRHHVPWRPGSSQAVGRGRQGSAVDGRVRQGRSGDCL